ncbi:hypothetical protein GOP47_0001993 [Adiantum capillus-veneris]|uniref:non-specific serine/threonine protein kinase n=1 Tax=Adiantum capillus-veneris TaxID=13818 RepID=A0A9D4VA33_ADICA|nr:hypothetical protein GOP47_0001993 [Adiantum capillus-veneris]
MASSIRSFFNKLFSTSNSSRTSCMQSSDGEDYELLSESRSPQIEWSSCVYKGQLPDGAQIAVKRWKYDLFTDINGFCSEVQFLGRFRHKNLLGLKGYCAEGRERMLVFDYMSNSSLHAHLHGDLEKEQQLDWHKRMAIACGCAEGLVYLHYYADSELVHGNIKSSNVLLGPAFEPKIVDFGLSRLLNDNVARARGSFGYTAPEDAQGEALTQRSDVFGFGILLLELISGKNPAEKIQSGTRKQSIVEWAQDLVMGGKMDELVDSMLHGKYNHEELEDLLNLAIMCAQLKPEDRLTMLEVVEYLKGSRHLECDNTLKLETKV